MNRWPPAARMAKRLGYPGLVLVVFGWFWCWIGVGVLVRPDYNAHLIHTHLPIWARVSLWASCGLASIALAWFRPRHTIGFALLFVPPAERAISYCVALTSGVSPDWIFSFGALLAGWQWTALLPVLTGRPIAGLLTGGPALQWVVGAAVWSSMTLAIVLFAAWPEPPERTHAP